MAAILPSYKGMKYSLTLLFALFFFSGCGSESEAPNEPAAAASAETSAVEEPIRVEGDTVYVEMTGNDRMRYNLETITAKVGQTIELTFHNIGKMPKAAMGHNVVFLSPGSDANAYAAAAAQSKANDYIPESMETFAHTELLGPGESDTIEFKVTEAGEYPFLCSFPAHLFAGMRGTLIVEE